MKTPFASSDDDVSMSVHVARRWRRWALAGLVVVFICFRAFLLFTLGLSLARLDTLQSTGPSSN